MLKTDELLDGLSVFYYPINLSHTSNHNKKVILN